MEIERLDENGKVTQQFYEYALKCCNEGIEIWADINGYEKMYQVSNFGRVKSLSRQLWNGSGSFYSKEKYIKKETPKNGYSLYRLYKNGICFSALEHRLVAIAFIPNPENKPEVNHEKGIKTNCSVTELNWKTSSENMIHAHKTGLKKGTWLGKFGKDHSCSIKIIQFDLKGNKINTFGSIHEAKRETGIDNSTIGKCCNGKSKTAGGYKWSYEFQT